MCDSRRPTGSRPLTRCGQMDATARMVGDCRTQRQSKSLALAPTQLATLGHGFFERLWRVLALLAGTRFLGSSYPSPLTIER
jgi:hypothetical protein